MKVPSPSLLLVVVGLIAILSGCNKFTTTYDQKTRDEVFARCVAASATPQRDIHAWLKAVEDCRDNAVQAARRDG
jgi:hypothetical protein